MNRKQKIIISVTGIFIVLLILVGLTYAYFLTRIQGNTNTKSISVTTANLELTYSDNSAEILGKDLKLIPSDTEIGTKTFTVTNNGDDTSYVVVIENVSITKDGTTTTFESNDFRYTLSCTKKDGTSCDGVSTQSVFPISGGVLVGNSISKDDVHTYTFKMWYIDTGKDQSNDMGKTIQARINITDIRSMTNPYFANTNSLAYNIIENARNKANGTELLSSPKTKVGVDVTGRYKTGEYLVHELDMSDINGDVDWYYGSTYNSAQPWNFEPTEEESYEGTVKECSDTIVGKYISYEQFDVSWYVKACKSSTIAIVEGDRVQYEQTLQPTNDDYGTSYYFRGNVKNNYVNFAGMCWRIVRISGDGSIKLILEDKGSICEAAEYTGNWSIGTGNFGYTEYAANTLTASDGTKNVKAVENIDYLNGGTNKDKSMATAFKNFQTGSLANYLDKLKAGDWCLNDKAYTNWKDNTTPLTSQEILDKQIKGTSFYYDSYVRLSGKSIKEPTLKCNGTVMTKFGDNTMDMYVGTLTADEITFAGDRVGTPDFRYTYDRYLVNKYQSSNSVSAYFWTLSPAEDGQALTVTAPFENGIYPGGISDSYNSFRPSINLKSGIQITGGDGTKLNPYIVG